MMKRLLANDIWEYWETKFLQLSEERYGEYIPEVGFLIGLIISAARDKDKKWLLSSAFRACCVGAALDAEAVRACLLFSFDYIKRKHPGNFNFNQFLF